MITILTAAAVAAVQPASSQAQPAPAFEHKSMDHSTMDHGKMDHSKMAHGDGCCCCHGGDGAMGCKKPTDGKSGDPAQSSH